MVSTVQGWASALESERAGLQAAGASALAKVKAAKQASASAVRHAKHEIVAAQQRAAKQVEAAEDRATRAEQTAAAANAAAANATAATTQPADVPGYVLLDLGSSHFKREYGRQSAPRYPGVLLEAVASIVHGFCGARGIPDDAAHEFIGKLLEQHKEHLGVGEMAVALTAQELWTATEVVEGGPELCTMYNAVLREDLASLAASSATLARSLNSALVWPDDDERQALPFPGGAKAAGRNKSTGKGKCFRGGGFLDSDTTRAFFGQPKHKFRVPQFLATSFSRPVAEDFVRRAEGALAANPGGAANATVLWTILLDGKQRCFHVNRLTESHVENEVEFLFAAFSAFSVVKAVWSKTPTNAKTPHHITIRAAVDNADEPEDLPLAPWC